MEFDTKKLTQEYILNAKIKGEYIIAVIRLILLAPLFGFAIAIVITNIPDKGLAGALSDYVFWFEMLFLIISAFISVITIRVTRRKQYANWMKYLLPLFDIGLVTVTVGLVADPQSGLMFTGAPPWLFIIFLILFVLRNSPLLVIITGSVISVLHLSLSIFSMAVLDVLSGQPDADMFLSKLYGHPIRVMLDDMIIKSAIILIFTALLAYIAQRFNKMVEEQITIRVEREKLRLTLSGELKSVTDSINSTSLTLVTTSHQFTNTVDTMVDSCQRIETATNEESAAVEETSATITEMIRSIESVAHNIAMQADLVTSSVSAIEEIGASINHIASTSKKATSIATSLLSNVENGEHIMEEVSSAINETERASKRIEEIVEIITSIAGETDLLAMNAAIEAAHAGDAGKGFAVVADEIRNLAENSSTNAKLINDILKDLSGRIIRIAELIGSAVSSLGGMLKDARETSQINREVLNAMEEESKAVNEIVRTTQELSKITSEVKLASAEQAAGGTQVMNVITHIKRQTDNVYGLSKAQAHNSNQISTLMKELRDIVAQNQRIISSLDQLVKKL